MYKITPIAFTLLLIITCSNELIESNKFYKISGNVYQKGIPAPNVTVAVDNKLNWTTQTNNDGYFEISDVTEGNHVLKSSFVQENGSFIEKSNEITVNNDIYLDALRLPNALILSVPSEITSSSMTLEWTKSDAVDFREYKLYRHNTSGLDETTGTLVHVATSVNDTIFVDDQLSPFEEYFYRVYVMNDFGRLGGSNIVSDTTEQINLIWNGDFELNDDLLTWWDNTEGYVQYTEQFSASGEHSLYMKSDSMYDGGQWVSIATLSKDISKTSFPLESGRMYKLSGWIKTKGKVGPSPVGWPYGGGHIRLELGNGNSYFLHSADTTDWVYLEQTFVTPENFNGWISLGTSSEYTWFDNIRLGVSDK